MRKRGSFPNARVSFPGNKALTLSWLLTTIWCWEYKCTQLKSTPTYAFKSWCLIKHRNKFISHHWMGIICNSSSQMYWGEEVCVPSLRFQISEECGGNQTRNSVVSFSKTRPERGDRRKATQAVEPPGKNRRWQMPIDAEGYIAYVSRSQVSIIYVIFLSIHVRMQAFIFM
jgi:hypothetical protein